MKKQLLSLLFVVGAMLWSTQGYSQCSVLTGPYTEDFEAYTSGSSSDPLGGMSCWKYFESGIISSSNYPYGYLRNYSFYANSGSQFLYMYKSSSSTWLGDSAAFMSPKFDLSSGTYEVILAARTLSTSSSYSNKLYIGVADSAGTKSSVTIVDTLDLTTTTYSNYTVDLTSSSGVGTGDSRVVFMMKGDGSTGYAYIDDVKIRVKSSCNDISNLAGSTTSTGVGLSWDGDAAHTSYTIEYDTAGFTPGTGSTMTVTVDTAHLTGLTPSVNYDFYVTGNCSSTSSGYPLSITVATPCAAVATPYTQNWDGTSAGSYTNPSLPTCWEYYSNGTYPYWYVRNYNQYTTPNALYGYMSSGTPNGSTYGDTAFAASPEIQGLDSATKQIEFWARKDWASDPGVVLLGVTDANATPSSLKIIDTINLNSTTYEKYTVYLDAAAGITTGDKRVAFVWLYTGAADWAWIDDLTISDIPPCPEPLSIGLTGATQTTASLTWSSSSSAFNIEVGPVGFTQGTGSVGTSTTNAYTATGLASNTYYDAYVMSNCTATGDGTSNWVGPFTFKTECGDFIVPLTEGFENQSGNTSDPDLPECWAYEKTGTSSSLYAYAYNSTTYSNTGSKSLRFYGYAYSTSSNNAFGDTLAAFSPRIAGLGDADKQLIFNGRNYFSSSSYVSKLIIATADTNASLSSISIVDTIEFSGGAYTEYTIDLDGVSSDASRVVFMMVPEYAVTSGTISYGYNYAFIDDITIRDIPQCPVATDFTGFATSDSSASLSWSDSSLVNSYVIEWGPCGFTQGTGAPMDTIVGNSWTIDSLMSETCYDFYVQSNCMTSNGSVSPWVGPVTIEMPCAATTAPLIEGFENLAGTYGTLTDPNLADCWIQDRGTSSSYVRGMSNTYGAYAGNGYMEFWGLDYVSDTVLLSSPAISGLDTGGHMVTFYALVNSTSYLGEMEVGVSAFSGQLASARAVKHFELTTAYQKYVVYLDSNVTQSGDARVAFILPEGNGQWNDLKIDSVSIETMPSCFSYNQMAASIADTSAGLSWDYTGTNCFNVEYGLAGFIQGTGVGALAGTVDSNVTSTHTLTGLNPNTTYDFYVESCCNPGTWEGPFTFTTECTGPLAAGTYSVGPTGDFATMDSVISTLNVCGIAGAVTFELQSGSHAGGTIGAVNGVSSTNTITFSGASAANDTLGPLVLDGASYVNLEDLYIRATGGFTVRLNATEYVNITGCTIETSSAASTANIPIVASASATSYSSTTEGEQYLTISDNTIFGGYFGMAMYGSSSSLGATHDVTVSNNDFVGQYYYGLYLYYARDVQVSDNYFGQFVNSTNYAGYLYQMDGCRFTGNEVESYYSILAYYWNTSVDATVQSEISNNMFKNGYYGLRIYYGAEVGVYHNTIVGSTYGLYDYYNGSSLDYRNNIIQGGTYAMYSYNSGSNFDYNVYNSLGSTLAYIYNGSFNYPTDLTSLQAVDTTMNMNSKVGNPVFAGSGDYHVVGTLANDAGDNSVGITVDFDGDARPTPVSNTVDIGADEFDVVYHDAALTAITSPSGSVCGGDSIEVVVEVTNLGVTPLTSTDITVNVAGQTISGTYSLDTLQLGEAEEVSVGYFSQYVGGFVTIDAEVDLSNDARANNDMLSSDVEILDAQQVVPVAPAMVCAGETVDLSIAHPTEGMLLWSTQQGDTLGLVNADSTISITVNHDTTITLSAVASPTSIQNTKGIGTAGSNYNFYGTVGVLFSATQAFLLDSVTLYPNAAGSTSIEIQDVSTGTAVWSGSVSTTATGNTAEQVSIGAQIQPGNYRMVATASTTGGLYREYGVSGYPFSTTGGEVSITQGTLTNYHYFFYEWVVTVGGCEREDSTFTIEIYPDAVANISVDTANATISATDWTANWSTSGTTGADSVYVEFSNGTTSSDTSGMVTFTANMAGESVTVIAFGPCSSDTMTFTFDVNQISVDEDFMNGTLSIYPNPTRGLFNVEFATTANKDVEISIVNMVGQVISRDVVTVNGVYQNQFDLSEASAGVYFITFKTDEGVLTERITVE